MAEQSPIKASSQYMGGRHVPTQFVAGEFDPVPFAEGRFRLAYKGIYTDPPSKKGMSCVLKEEKSTQLWGHNGWKKIVNIYKIAKSLAEEFNKEELSSKTVEYVDVVAGKVDRTKYAGGPKVDEVFFVEDYLPGEFTKWCTNYGYISETSDIMPAFMHWTWAKTKGEKMIADLQGVQEETRYLLTDPAIMSSSLGDWYGPTDTGIEGIALFFINHSCTEICSKLPRPNLKDVLEALPDKAKSQLLSMQSSTVYSHELLIPNYLKQALLDALSENPKKK